MKKLIIVLMVVAVASFLFVGCLPDAVTPAVTPTEPTEPTEPTVAKTDTPYITAIEDVDLSSTATQYSNNPTVAGVGVPGAVIKVYINGVQSGIGYTGATGVFAPDPITVTLVDLTEGVTTLYVTATQPGLAESDKSTTYTFTYDETGPKIVSAVADSGTQLITVTFDEAVDCTATPAATAATAATGLYSALNEENWKVNGLVLVFGTDEITKVSSTVVEIDPGTAVETAAAVNFYTLSFINIRDSLGNKTSATVYSSPYIDITVP